MDYVVRNLQFKVEIKKGVSWSKTLLDGNINDQ